MPNRFAQLTILGAIATSLASPVSSRAADKTPISFYVFGDLAEKAAYQTLVTAFSQKHPEIDVNMVYSAGEDEFPSADGQDAYRARLSLDFASSKAPDVFLINYREYGIFGEKGQLEPVGQYLTHSTVIQAGDFYPQAMAAFTRNNVLDCIPQNLSGTVVYYNKDLFQKAKRDWPKADWTWDDFLSTAQALTDTTHEQYGLGVDSSFARLMPFIWQNKGEVTDIPPTKIAMDSPAVSEAMQWFVDLLGKYHVIPDETHVKAQNVEDRFLAGTEAMLIFSRRIVPSLRLASFDWDVAPLPQRQQAATLQYSDGYCMARSSPNHAAAWTLIEYANSIEGQTILAKTGRTVPSLKAVANSPIFLDPTKKPLNSQVFLDIIPTMRTAPLLANYADLEETINQQLESTFYGDQGVAAAIKAIGENTK